MTGKGALNDTFAGGEAKLHCVHIYNFCRGADTNLIKDTQLGVR